MGFGKKGKKGKEKDKEKPKLQKAKFERPYYIWEDGRKTHFRFIQLAIQQSKPLPVGFYEAAKASKDLGIKKLLQVAEARKIPATAGKIDTRQ